MDERLIISSLAEAGLTTPEETEGQESGSVSGSRSPRRQLTTESVILHSSAPNLSPSLTQQSSESSGGRARLTQTGSAPADKRWYPEEDLSRPYNHYRCLAPAEHSSGAGLVEKRTLKRQFSLDKDDDSHQSQHGTRRSLLKQNSAGAAGNTLTASPPRDLSCIQEMSQERRGSHVSSCFDLGMSDSSKL